MAQGAKGYAITALPSLGVAIAMPLGPLGSQTPQPSIGMQFEEAEGGIAVAMATDNDKEVRPIGDCGAHGVDALYLNQKND